MRQEKVLGKILLKRSEIETGKLAQKIKKRKENRKRKEKVNETRKNVRKNNIVEW